MKSIQQHIAQGTFRKDRHEGKGPVSFLETEPEPPKNLPKKAHGIWRDEVGQIFQITQLSAKDLSALRELVLNLYYMELAAADLEANGLTITAELKAGTKTVTNPAWRIFQDAQRIVFAIRKEFGLTPLSGQRMTLPEPPRPDPLADLLTTYQ